jgi:hypothetical protein
MPVFVFGFGYEAPWERDSNERYGTDFESSQYVVTDAPDEQAALNWGCEVAERFVQKECGESWRAGNFAYSVEPLSACPWAAEAEVVTVGQLPAFSR